VSVLFAFEMKDGLRFAIREGVVLSAPMLLLKLLSNSYV